MAEARGFSRRFVDWGKTEAPDYGYEGEFAGTESEPNRVMMLKGILILKNGEKIPCLSKFDLKMNVFEMAEAMNWEAMTRMGGMNEVAERRIQMLLDYFFYHADDHLAFAEKYSASRFTFRMAGVSSIENIQSDIIRWEKYILEQHATSVVGTRTSKRI